jgi:hypothetical protein
MGQAKLRKVEIAALKSAGNNGKNTAIRFNFKIADHEYKLLAVYEPHIIKEMQANNYDNDKCLDIIMDASRNLLAVKNGADMSDPRAGEAVKSSMRSVALAVMRHAILDQYRSVALMPDCVLTMSLEEDADSNIGYNLLGQGQSLFLMERNIQKRIDSAQADGVDFVVTIA